MNDSDSFNGTASAVVEFSHVDYAIVTVLLLISLAIGVFIAFFHNGGQTTDDFMFGGFNMSILPVALSLLARWIFRHLTNRKTKTVKIVYCVLYYSQLSPIVLLTMPVEIYQYGWQYTLFIPALALVTLALCYIFLPILYQNKLDNCYTVNISTSKMSVYRMWLSGYYENYFLFTVFRCAISSIGKKY